MSATAVALRLPDDSTDHNLIFCIQCPSGDPSALQVVDVSGWGQSPAPARPARSPSLVARLRVSVHSTRSALSGWWASPGHPRIVQAGRLEFCRLEGGGI